MFVGHGFWQPKCLAMTQGKVRAFGTPMIVPVPFSINAFRHQSDHRDCPRPRYFGDADRARRRGDRISLATSAVGTDD
jgi:hypothetical protein